MNKLGKRQYTKLIVEAMTEAYGNTLWEYNTDLDMAKKVLKKLTPYLNFNEQDMTEQEFKQWRVGFIDDITGYND